MSEADETLIHVAEQLREAIDLLVQAEVGTAGVEDVLRTTAWMLAALREMPLAEPVADPIRRGSATRNPINGLGNPIAPPADLRLVQSPSGGKVARGTVTFSHAYQGKPGYVHGGCIAMVFDQLLGYAKLVPALTASLTVDYRGLIHIGEEIALAAELVDVDGRRRRCKGTMHVADELVAEATALFIVPKAAGEEALEEYPLTEDPTEVLSTNE